MPDKPQVGLAMGLAVYGPNMAMVIEVEVATVRVARGEGQITVTGVIEEEEMGGTAHRVRRKSMAKGSVENVLTVLRRYLGVDPRDFDIHVNFPGGVPVDGPSAGVAVATAIYSALTGVPVHPKVAMTGELSIRGQIKPVGGIVAKIQAARWAGAQRIIIPKENWQEMMREEKDVEIIPASNLAEVLREALLIEEVSEAEAREARPGAEEEQVRDSAADGVEPRAGGEPEVVVRDGAVPVPAAAAGLAAPAAADTPPARCASPPRAPALTGGPLPPLSSGPPPSGRPGSEQSPKTLGERESPGHP